MSGLTKIWDQFEQNLIQHGWSPENAHRARLLKERIRNLEREREALERELEEFIAGLPMDPRKNKKVG